MLQHVKFIFLRWINRHPGHFFGNEVLISVLHQTQAPIPLFSDHRNCPSLPGKHFGSWGSDLPTSPYRSFLCVFELSTGPLECISLSETPLLSFRGLPQWHLAGRRKQPRDAGALCHHPLRHAAHQHQLPHRREDGADAAGLPLPPRGAGRLQPLRPGEAWQEAA